MFPWNETTTRRVPALSWYKHLLSLSHSQKRSPRGPRKGTRPQETPHGHTVPRPNSYACSCCPKATTKCLTRGFAVCCLKTPLWSERRESKCWEGLLWRSGRDRGWGRGRGTGQGRGGGGARTRAGPHRMGWNPICQGPSPRLHVTPNLYPWSGEGRTPAKIAGSAEKWPAAQRGWTVSSGVTWKLLEGAG